MKKIVAIIFDLDGTLYPRNSPLYQSMSLLIRQWFRIQLGTDDTDHYERMKRMYPSPLEAIQVFELDIASFHKDVFDRLNPELYLTENTKLQNLLELLPGKKFVVTLSSYKYAERVLKILGVRHFFSDIIVNSGSWHTSTKIDAYETIRQTNNWKPTEIYVVGDDPYVDLQDAYVAGYRCINVSDSIKLLGITTINTLDELNDILS
ncbi:MAG: hypothetical protein COT36_04635 [Parcubacteria group bacterium CG08_land_8_20_14_0_20_38_56]|nr:MAG: hypothetical protein COT36_04635 [Parcubacteria group bacterium CG08_land_8_20_14_0_20_38_56]